MPIINSTFTSKVRNPGKDTLLEYLARRFTYHSREEWADLIGKGRMELEGRRAAVDERLREGQNLLFHVVDYHEPEVPLDWHVLPMECEGPPPDDLLFVYKPAGMPVHRTGRIFFNTLANVVKERMGAEWAPLHRLDRETSGIVAFAKGHAALSRYSPSNPEMRWIKVYLAVVNGTPPGPGIQRIDQPLGELEGDEIRSRMHVHSAGKRAITLYQTLESGDGLSLMALWPITGRKHQLRAHMSWLGHPILGDKIYSGGGIAYLAMARGELEGKLTGGQGAESTQLHAMYLSLISRKTGKFAIECPLPFRNQGETPNTVSRWGRLRFPSGRLLIVAREFETFAHRMLE